MDSFPPQVCLRTDERNESSERPKCIISFIKGRVQREREGEMGGGGTREILCVYERERESIDIRVSARREFCRRLPCRADHVLVEARVGVPALLLVGAKHEFPRALLEVGADKVPLEAQVRACVPAQIGLKGRSRMD